MKYQQNFQLNKNSKIFEKKKKEKIETLIIVEEELKMLEEQKND